MSEPRVSIIIPTFNRSAMLRQAIASVLAQTYSSFEIIVSDNASTDDTLAVITLLSDARLKYFRNDRNLGMTPNWNAGIRRASGAYVVLLEDDNWWHPEYLARAVNTLDHHPEAAFVHTGANLTDAQGTVTQVYKRWGSDRICDKRGELIALMQGNKVYLSTAMVRRSLLESLGLFDETILFAPDWEMWLRVYTHHDSAYVAESLLFYRQHDASITRQFLAQPVALFDDHRLVIEKIVQRVRGVHGARFAQRLRKLSYRWLAFHLSGLARKAYREGKVELARQMAGLVWRCSPWIALRFQPRWLTITLVAVDLHWFGWPIVTMQDRLRRWLLRESP